MAAGDLAAAVAPALPGKTIAALLAPGGARA
jgi:hypothetical protein